MINESGAAVGFAFLLAGFVCVVFLMAAEIDKLRDRVSALEKTFEGGDRDVSQEGQGR